MLKTIRKQVAEANEIKYEPRECHHQGECRGTCPACEAEVRYIERQLDIRKQLGKAVTIVGISAGLSALSACSDKAQKVEEVEEDSLTVGKVMVAPATHLTGDIDYRSPEDCVIVEERQPTAKTRTAKFKISPNKEQADTACSELIKGAMDTIPAPPVEGQLPEKIFGDVVEQMPSFPGGQAALMQWLSSNMKYPTIAAENGVQGRVIVQFVVEKDGSVTDVHVAKSVDPSLDKEAARVVKAMPKWIPGKQNGSAVRVKYTVPVTFKLQ